MMVAMKTLKSFLKTMACSLLLAAVLPLTASAAPIDDFFIAIKNDNDGDLVTILFRGFDANTVDAEGRHGLHIAIMESSLKVTKTLLDLSGTKVDTRSKQGESPLMMAALKGHTAIAKRLIARGADVNKTGWTPLHYAASGGHVEMIKLLLEEHAYIDAESPNKSTPLMMAALYGTEDATKLLIKEGADPTVKNDQGMTAADFANGADRKALANDLAKAIIAFKAIQNAPTNDTLDGKEATPSLAPSLAPAPAPAPAKADAEPAKEAPKQPFKTRFD